MANRIEIWSKSLLSLIGVLCFACQLVAQTHQGTITGRISDPDGAVIPGVEVTAANEETGTVTRGRSNEAGVYILPFLAPGQYVVKASSSGFSDHQIKGVAITTGQDLTVDIQMEVGAVTETVTVTDEAPLLATNTATADQLITSREVSEMPLGNRRSLQLARLAGGVVFLPGAGGDKPAFSIAGGRAWNQMFWLDGGNIQNMRLGVGQVDTDPPVDIIREFRVIQNTYKAEYGGSAGGVIVSTTKSGTNKFHGSLYEFFRNEKLDAADFFAPTSGDQKVKAPLRFNQFGGTLGGPIIQDRTHFFVAYEGRRRRIGSPQILTVPTALQRAGDFSGTLDTGGALVPIYDPTTTQVVNGETLRQPFANNVIPQDRLDPVAKQLVSFWPAANRPASNLAGAQNFAGNRSSIGDNDVGFARVDHAFSDENRFYFRYLIQNAPSTWSSNYPQLEADPQGNFVIDTGERTYLVADTHTLSPNLILDFRYTFGDRYGDLLPAGFGSTIVDEIGLQGVPTGAFPQMNVTGFAGLGNGNIRFQRPIRQHQIVNTWTWVRGKHVFKFGGEFRQSQSAEMAQSGAFGFTPNETGLPGAASTGFGLASFLTGWANSFSTQATDPLDRHSWYEAFFVQDDWKVTPHLTFNLGLRWETDTAMVDANDRFNSFDPSAINPVSGTPGVVRFAGVDGSPTTPYNTDWNNFGPRFGFAWQPGGQNWVIRGGYGISFDHPFNTGAPNRASLGFQSSADLSSPDNGITPAVILADGITGLTLRPANRDDSFGAVPVGSSPTTNVDFFERNRATGYAQQYNLSLQRQLPGNMVFEATYLANLGRKMSVRNNLAFNQVRPELLGPGNAQVRRPFPQFNNVNILLPPLGVTNYHAGVFRLEKRFSGGLNFLTTYTWSRNIGNIPEFFDTTVGSNQEFQNFYNRSLDKGPSALDIVHNFNWSSVYDLPFGKDRRWLSSGALGNILGGWTVGSIINLQSGGALTASTSPNQTNAFSAGAVRSDVIRDPNLSAGQRTIQRWFDIDAFVAPAPFTFGNAGRGIIRSDGRVSFDFSLNKSVYFTETVRLQFRGEIFNAFNHPDFRPPANTRGTASFGTVSAATEGRTVQLGLRLVF